MPEIIIIIIRLTGETSISRYYFCPPAKKKKKNIKIVQQPVTKLISTLLNVSHEKRLKLLQINSYKRGVYVYTWYWQLKTSITQNSWMFRQWCVDKKENIITTKTDGLFFLSHIVLSLTREKKLHFEAVVVKIISPSKSRFDKYISCSICEVKTVLWSVKCSHILFTTDTVFFSYFSSSNSVESEARGRVFLLSYPTLTLAIKIW